MRTFDRNAKGWRRAIPSVALACALASALAGCGESSADSDVAADGTRTVTFAYVPNPGIAPVFVGIDQGFFKDEGIDLKPVLVAAGQLSPTIMSGENDLAFDAIQGVLGSVSNGLPIQVVAQTSTNNEGAESGTGRDILVLKGSDIDSFEDLDGKKLGVQRLGAAGDVAVQQVLRSADPDAKAAVLALPVESMESALLKGDVDAVNVSDPTASKMLASGKFEALGDPAVTAFGSAPDKVIIAATKWIDENPDLVEALQAAIAASAAYAQENPDAIRDVMVNDWETPSDVAELTHWPEFTDEVDVAATQQIADAMSDLDLLAKPVDADAVFAAKP